MKNTIVSAAYCLIFIPGIVRAQDKGHITYEMVSKLELGLMPGMDSAMLAQIPREHRQMRDFYFNTKHAVYQMRKAAPKEKLSGEQHGIVMNFDEPNDLFYTDSEAGKRLEQRDFMSRLFLIEYPIEAPKWKLSGAQKLILGYPCQEAVIADSMQDLRIWFTPAIDLPFGPGMFTGFPGLVLQVEMDGGRDVITATEIDANFDPTPFLIKPSEGKKMNPEKFNQLMEEKMKEMQEQYGGDGQTIIRIIEK